MAEEENAKTELVPDISEQVAKEGLFDDKKVQTFDSFMEGAQAVSEMDKNKDKHTLNNVENFVIIKTEKDIAFDTSKVVDAIRYDDIYYIQYETIQDAKDAVETFQSYPTVEYVTPWSTIEIIDEMKPVYSISSSQDTNGYIHYSWGAIDMKVDVLSDYVATCTNDSVTVAVIDTGVDATHPYLSGRILGNGYDFADNDYTPNDLRGHGTHVAGTIVDCTQGLNVNILPLKVFGSEGGADDITVANAIQYAINAGADIINLSLGRPKDNSLILDDAILYRFAQFKNFDVSASADISGYTDVSRVDSYARDAVEWAVGMQIMGQDTTNLNPAGYANRAEIATMISRFAQTYNM